MKQEQKNWSMKLNFKKVPASFSIISLMLHSKVRHSVPYYTANKTFNISVFIPGDKCDHKIG